MARDGLEHLADGGVVAPGQCGRAGRVFGLRKRKAGDQNKRQRKAGTDEGNSVHRGAPIFADHRNPQRFIFINLSPVRAKDAAAPPAGRRPGHPGKERPGHGQKSISFVQLQRRVGIRWVICRKVPFAACGST